MSSLSSGTMRNPGLRLPSARARPYAMGPWGSSTASRRSSCSGFLLGESRGLPCQPLDIGINKPFKARVRALWEEWMINEIDWTGMVYTPTREDISSWVAQVVWGMDGKPLMRNAWRKMGYDWFPEHQSHHR